MDSLKTAPDYHCIPVGNAGNITAYWIGYCEYSANHNQKLVTNACTLCHGDCPYTHDGCTQKRPIMIGYQATGAAPFLRGQPVDEPETIATAIRIGHPQAWQQAHIASKESGGWFSECTDETILATQLLLAEKEGIFCEPASAIALAGAIQDLQSGAIPEHAVIACTLTGHGLKDPQIAIQQGNSKIVRVEPTLDQIKKTILDDLP